MQSTTRVAIGSLAMLLLGCSAALAQPYGYGRQGYGGYGQDFARCYAQPYGAPDCVALRQTPAAEAWRYANAAVIPGFIIDPATGQPITSGEYRAKYPYSNPGTWQYDAVRNLWVDLTSQQSSGQAQNYDRYRGGDRERANNRGREGNYARDRGREDNYRHD